MCLVFQVQFSSPQCTELVHQIPTVPCINPLFLFDQAINRLSFPAIPTQAPRFQALICQTPIDSYLASIHSFCLSKHMDRLSLPASRRPFRSSSVSPLRESSCSRKSMILRYLLAANSYLFSLKNWVPFSLNTLACSTWNKLLNNVEND